MAHFAEIDENNIVIQVLVVSNDDEERGEELCQFLTGSVNRWVQTSYNGNFRYRYAGIGYSYSEDADAFIPPMPEDAIGFDEEAQNWIIPELEKA